MTYFLEQSEDFLNVLKKLRKKDPPLYDRVKKKITQILENPYHYKELGNVLKGCYRTHVGSYVLIFEVIESENAVRFINFDHHDNVYK